MKRTAILVALALAPSALGCNEFPGWHTQARARTAAFVGGAGLRALPRAPVRDISVCPAMQTQSAVQDPPRFNDVKLALTGVVTRAERQAMMITSRAARLASRPAAAGMPVVAASLRAATWAEVTVGYGVNCRKVLDEHLGQPALRRAVGQIHRATLEAVAEPWSMQELVFSAEEVKELRTMAEASYLDGQRKMTKLGQLLAARVMSSGYECRSMVTGESGADTEEFRISQVVPLEGLNGNVGSLDLAQQQLQGLKVGQVTGGWKEAGIVDASVEFEALESNDMNVAKVLAHARPGTELWRFISDSVFDIDYAEMGATEEGHDSMFEIKILVESLAQADLLHRDLRLIQFKDSELMGLHVPVSDASRSVELVSQTKSHRKSKIVWQGVGMSIQVQTLDEHYIESELSTMAVRAQEEARREDVCQELERRVSLFKFSRDLLHWLFASSSMRHPPSSDRITVKLSS
mmetsp:Transcript_41116/g.66210  ORF Transcript_41116/g.66210 Transcript_41116/m.66210 type:complete len:464 (-) Transcript_41116:380-1771(-)|eukprot:CAMPEP_0179433258 /NCGR_PEP_ID=MMETSP0799-20121207/17697_1 /TAXON_ID=46947 /ORGANISM="Geminigera cryophila, Strain CCMP2564" /LENGTH=463 /DNA_ID=CAMNT_0021211107 /DNA_START=206 /DNA_END=1597 /DNA_ORIENTATION=+